MMKTTLNQLVKISGLSRYHIEKIISDLQLEPETEIRKNIKVSVFDDQQKQQILEAAQQKTAAKKESVNVVPVPHSNNEHAVLLSELTAAKAQLQLLIHEHDYLKEALKREQENSKVLSEQLANSDQRMSVVIAALSQPKELTDKTAEKRGFWQRLFG